MYLIVSNVKFNPRDIIFSLKAQILTLALLTAQRYHWSQWASNFLTTQNITHLEFHGLGCVVKHKSAERKRNQL